MLVTLAEGKAVTRELKASYVVAGFECRSKVNKSVQEHRQILTKGTFSSFTLRLYKMAFVSV
jgi:hypothetical protein